MSDIPDIAVVIPTWNSSRWIEACLAAVRNQTLRPTEIVVVDDGSVDDTADWLSEHATDVHVERLAEHSGFAAAVNRGIRSSTSPLVALLNVDTVPAPGWLENLAAVLGEDPRRPGFVASKMVQLSAPDKMDAAGDTFSRYGSAHKRGHGDAEQEWTTREPVLSASAGAALYRRSMLEETGLFDEAFESYLEDVDLGLRARSLGYECLFAPEAIVHHEGGGSGLPRPRYVRLVTANRVASLLKNFPGRLLWRHGLRLLWGQWYFLVALRHPGSSLAGYWDVSKRLPAIIKERQRCQARRTLSVSEFDELLDRGLGEPPLRQLVFRRIGRR